MYCIYQAQQCRAVFTDDGYQFFIAVVPLQMWGDR